MASHHDSLVIERIQRRHDAAMASIIEWVGAEFGAVGEGYGPSDPEVQQLSAHYTVADRACYWIARRGEQVLGGGGLAPFNASRSVCELRKFFILPEARGLGLGRRLATTALAFAVEQGFSQCYLDTMKGMESAIALYESLGFYHLNRPIAGTIHDACDVWMMMDLQTASP